MISLQLIILRAPMGLEWSKAILIQAATQPIQFKSSIPDPQSGLQLGGGEFEEPKFAMSESFSFA